ncbi:sporulation protein [Streptomyces sp. NPDC014861]|uniref:sporulation protein n=1 Tax=Streptomyces sp. NPDC014861 TaxID=3364923 RepID=UPI0036FEBDB0
MVFKKLLGSLGVGGPTVDTVLDPGPVRPGDGLTGQVHLKGGGADFDIERITLELVARVEAEHEDGETEGVAPFGTFTVAGGFSLAAGERRSVPFTVALPWETPITELYGQDLGIVLGIRTELALAGAKDKGDLDPVAVTPLPVQEAVLEAFGRLGFGFKSADLEYGHIRGAGQQLPFYQEIELVPAPQYAQVMRELEVTFLAGPGGMEVVLEADRPGGFLSSGRDVLNRHVVSHDDVAQRDWNAVVDAWIRELPAAQGHHGVSAPHGHADAHGGHHFHGDHDAHRSGPGVGTAVAAGAAGLAVGFVAAEVVDEVGDFFEDEGDDEGDEGDSEA